MGLLDLLEVVGGPFDLLPQLLGARALDPQVVAGCGRDGCLVLVLHGRCCLAMRLWLAEGKGEEELKKRSAADGVQRLYSVRGWCNVRYPGSPNSLGRSMGGRAILMVPLVMRVATRPGGGIATSPLASSNEHRTVRGWPIAQLHAKGLTVHYLPWATQSGRIVTAEAAHNLCLRRDRENRESRGKRGAIAIRDGQPSRSLS